MLDFRSFTGNHVATNEGEARVALETMFSQHGFAIGENLKLLWQMLTHLSQGQSEAALEAATKFASNVGIKVYRVGDPNEADGRGAMFTYERHDETWIIQMCLGPSGLWTESKGPTD